MALIRGMGILLTAVKTVPIAVQGKKIHRWVAPTLMQLKLREKKQGGKITHPRNTFLEWNLEAELFAFAKRLNEDFDSDLLLQAFTDRSYVIKEEMKQTEMGININMKDNRELVEEGDRFIKRYIQLYLENVLPKFPLEGVNAVAQHLTCEDSLAHVSLHLGTKDIILAAEYPVNNLILANALKAIVAALLRSSGEERAAHFSRDFIITLLQGKDINDYWKIEDPWAMLTDILNKEGQSVEPRLIGEVGKHTLLACYRVGLYVDRKMISSGFGETVATAKAIAAHEALKKIFGTEDHMKPIDFQIEGIPKSRSQPRYQITAS